MENSLNEIVMSHNRTPNLGKFLEAFCEAQNEFKNVPRTKQGLGYKYAELAHYTEMVRPILNKHKLAIFQTYNSNSSKDLIIRTDLYHISDEGISSLIIVKNEWLMPELSAEEEAHRLKNTPPDQIKKKNPARIMQIVGAACTYFRRQEYISILGLAAEDDDGTGMGAVTKHSLHNVLNKEIENRRVKAPPISTPRIAPPQMEASDNTEEKVTKERIQRLKELCTEHFIPLKEFTDHYKIKSAEPDTLIGAIENFPEMKTKFEEKKFLEEHKKSA